MTRIATMVKLTRFIIEALFLALCLVLLAVQPLWATQAEPGNLINWISGL